MAKKKIVKKIRPSEEKTLGMDDMVEDLLARSLSGENKLMTIKKVSTFVELTDVDQNEVILNTALVQYTVKAGSNCLVYYTGSHRVVELPKKEFDKLKKKLL